MERDDRCEGFGLCDCKLAGPQSASNSVDSTVANDCSASGDARLRRLPKAARRPELSGGLFG